MIEGKRIAAIIPARGGSKRLKKKNIYLVWGHPMLAWSILDCRKSKYIDDVYVTSEDDNILKVAEEYGAFPVKRPEDLAQDHIYKQYAIVHAARFIEETEEYKTPDIVISLQPNSPEEKWQHLDGAIEKFIKYKRQEIFSVDKNLNQNAAFRVITFPGVFLDTLSVNCGVYVAELFDVHKLEDVEYLEKTKKRVMEKIK